jgi:hypothetical protein
MLGLGAIVCAGFLADGFTPGELMVDTDGHRIRAHQPHIFHAAGIYYWYGAAHVGSSDGSPGTVNLYTSSDLYNWDFRGGVYNQSYAARPSMLGKNPKTGKYVLWSKGGKSFQSATSDSLLGPFVQAGSYVPEPNCNAGDSASFLDPSTGEAYMVYSQHKCHGQSARAIKVLKLNDAWTAPDTDAAPGTTVAGNLEAPCAFYSALTKQRYVWTSHTSGWNPNAAELLSTSLPTMASGEGWISHGNPSGNTTTFGTQGSHILRLGSDGNGSSATERWLYMGDRYEPYISTAEGSRYIFLALEVRAGGDVLLHRDEPWSVEDWPAA